MDPDVLSKGIWRPRTQNSCKAGDKCLLSHCYRIVSSDSLSKHQENDLEHLNQKCHNSFCGSQGFRNALLNLGTLKRWHNKKRHNLHAPHLAQCSWCQNTAERCFWWPEIPSQVYEEAESVLHSGYLTLSLPLLPKLISLSLFQDRLFGPRPDGKWHRLQLIKNGSHGDCLEPDCRKSKH